MFEDQCRKGNDVDGHKRLADSVKKALTSELKT